MRASGHAKAHLGTLERQILSSPEVGGKLLEARQRNSGDLEMLSKSLKTMEKCRIIASRIMKGDKVPMKDLKFLMENDPAGYKLAMALRRNNPDPEEMDSVVEEMEKRHAGEGDSGGGEASQASAPAASSGGGEASAPAE